MVTGISEVCDRIVTEGGYKYKYKYKYINI